MPVKIEQLNDEFGEVLGGLKAGDHVILHPGDSVGENRRVAARSTP